MVEITNKDVKDVEELLHLLKGIDASSMEAKIALMDEIANKQPFLISFFLGYKPDYSMAALDEIVRMILLTWKHLQFDQPGKRHTLMEPMFTSQHERLLRMFNYAAGEPSRAATNGVLALGLTQLKSKSLLVTVAAQFEERPTLQQVPEAQKFLTIIDFYTLILCMEAL